ncbi:MAG: sialidase family protein, partial [Candidatus Binatia bacterium]
SRSTDNGASWTPFTSVGLNLLSNLHVATDGAGTWIFVGESTDDIGGTIGTDRDIVTVRSVDNAVTWLAPVPASGAVDGSISDFDPRIATDGAGTWVVIWDHDSLVSTETSFDHGLTWTAPVELDNVSGFFWWRQ